MPRASTATAPARDSCHSPGLPLKLRRAHATVAGSEAFGVAGQWEFVSADEASARVGATNVLGGIFTEHCALVQPDRLVRALAAKVEDLGGVIYENTAAQSIADGAVRTNHGTVTVGVVVRATEAYPPQFADSRRDVAPLYSLVVATAPIPQEIRESIGLTSRAAFNDMRHLRLYAHPTADGRLVVVAAACPTIATLRCACAHHSECA